MRVEKPERTIDFPRIEKEMLKKWDDEKTFERSISERAENKKFNFYDGPPFATGLPHFGHFVPSSLKDAFPRYFTMKGYRVERRFGWDCHGLPVELLVQKELGLNGRADIEKFGIDKFNQACRESVLRYTGEWREYMRRLGRWVDMDNEYRTMDPEFMESVWAVIKNLWNKGLIYEGRFVVSFSTALSSSLSNFEASLNYKDIQDPSVTIKAKLIGKHNGKSLLVWTTTPWTLPANLAIAIDPKATYAEVLDVASQDTLIVLKDRVSAYWPKEDSHKVSREFLGSEIDGESYEPFFDTFVGEAGANAFKVYGTNYVLHDTGTGAVHTAPAFGEDDFKCAEERGLPIIDHLDLNGCFTEVNMKELVGLNFKEGDKIVMADLKKRGLVFKHDVLVHSYPHCYRSDTPLIYRAMPTWFVKVTAIKDKLLANNEKINWTPSHIQHGRFGKWLEGARDWNISRNRFWGNPIPIWKNEDTGEIECIGSIAELEKHAGRKIDDIHMEFIDDITIPSKTGNGVLKRVPFVLDCWFESGSMPYAQKHYPFENEKEFDSLFPADFICEGLDQTRGWFYTLHVLATALLDKPAFNNVVVNGLVMASDGRKMSKSLKNYPDPMATLDSFGADAMRIFILNSPATIAEEVRFSEDGLKESIRKVLLPLWNAYSFFATYAGIDKFDPEVSAVKSKNELDIWILARTNELQKLVDENMMSYQIAKVCPNIVDFLDDLNNWYIRRSRRRFWDSDNEAYSTLYTVLVNTVQLLAPVAPFASEYFFGKLALTNELAKAGSVHLTILPEYRTLTEFESKLLDRTACVRRVVELGRNIRVIHKLKNRQPLRSITVGVLSEVTAANIQSMTEVIKSELNVKEVKISLKPNELAKVVIKPNLKILGKTLGGKIKDLQALLQNVDAATAACALRKETITLGEFTLPPEHVIVELHPTGNELVATDADLVASLDPTVTEELKLEGIARELVSVVQKARKAADFDVEDRINMKLNVSVALRSAINQNKTYIEEETLSTIVAELEKKPEHVAHIEIEGEQVELELSRS